MGTTAERVAQRFFESRYARLLQAMSMGEAKTILGFPSSSSPSPQEISKAYKRQSFENHPDRGGSHDKMVEINVAKDVLTGERAPTGPGGRRQRPADPPGGWRPEDRVRREDRPPPPPVEGKSFGQALSGIPSGVDWKFVSEPAYAQDLKSRPVEEGGAYWRYYYGWVAYGQTETHHVFVGLRAETGKQAITGDRAWEGIYVGAKRSLNLIRLAPKMVKQIIAGLTGLEKAMDNKYMVPKRYKVLSGTLAESDLVAGSRAGLSLKDAIIGSGAMPAGSAGLKGRKAVVTIEPEFNQAKYRAYKETGVRGENHRAYVWTVEVNGRGRVLKDNEVERLTKNLFMIGVFSYDYTKGKKNLTRLRGGRMGFPAAEALQRLADALNPGGLKDQVAAAAEQMAPARKAARDLLASMTLHDLALLEGEPLLTLFTEVLYG